MSLVCAGDTENEGSEGSVAKFNILSGVTLEHFVFHDGKTQLAAPGPLVRPL